jgi:hypothetical protein
MRRLIHSNLASAGKRDVGQCPPRGLLHIRATDIFLLQRGHHFFKIVAHQVKYGAEKIITGVLPREITVDRVNGGFCRRNSENHPSMSNIHKRKPKDIAEEHAIGFGIPAVKQEVGAEDHAAEYISALSARV